MEVYPTQIWIALIREREPDAEASLISCISDCLENSCMNIINDKTPEFWPSLPLTITTNDSEFNQRPARS